MKKFISLLLALILSLGLIGCGEVQYENDDDDIEEEEDEDDEDKDDEDDENKDDKDDKGKKDKLELVDFDNVVVTDNDLFSITVTDFEEDDFWGYELKVRLENKSDTSYTFNTKSVYVNGVQADALFYAEVDAGKKANETVTFFSEDFEEYGIDEFTDIELTFNVYDNSDWSTPDVDIPTVHIYPYGEDNAEQFVRESKNTDEIVIDNEYATITVIGHEFDDDFGYYMNLYIVNKSEHYLNFYEDDSSLNGYMTDPIFYDTLNPGKSIFTSVLWSTETLEENDIDDIDDIEEIEFSVCASDAEDWMAGYYFVEAITVNP